MNFKSNIYMTADRTLTIVEVSHGSTTLRSELKGALLSHCSVWQVHREVSNLKEKLRKQLWSL